MRLMARAANVIKIWTRATFRLINTIFFIKHFFFSFLPYLFTGHWLPTSIICYYNSLGNTTYFSIDIFFSYHLSSSTWNEKWTVKVQFALVSISLDLLVTMMFDCICRNKARINVTILSKLFMTNFFILLFMKTNSFYKQLFVKNFNIILADGVNVIWIVTRFITDTTTISIYLK